MPEGPDLPLRIGAAVRRYKLRTTGSGTRLNIQHNGEQLTSAGKRKCYLVSTKTSIYKITSY